MIVTLLVLVSAVYSYLNVRVFKLPGTIGIVSIAVCVSAITIIVDKANPGAAKYLNTLAKNINFSGAVLNIMLGFLLFAGAFNLNKRRLKREMLPVLVLSTISVIVSTVIFGFLFYWVTILFHEHISLIFCMLFGALISPTDPVAVAAVIKGSRLPANLETIISGESLFNDGIGLVLFITILELTESGSDHIDLGKTAILFVREVCGGLALGGAIGFIGYRLMRSITDFQTIVLVSLSMVMGISILASELLVSIPLAAVAAGLLAGNRSINQDNTEHSHQALEKFWQLVDEMLNTILFVMIGLQMVNTPYLDNYWLTGFIAILVILVARWLSIVLPLTFLKRTLNIKFSSINILTWAGLRGGISIALALSLPYTPFKHIILSGAYFIVIFSIIVQGLTLNKVINLYYKEEKS